MHATILATFQMFSFLFMKIFLFLSYSWRFFIFFSSYIFFESVNIWYSSSHPWQVDFHITYPHEQVQILQKKILIFIHMLPLSSPFVFRGKQVVFRLWMYFITNCKFYIMVIKMNCGGCAICISWLSFGQVKFWGYSSDGQVDINS